MLTTEWIRWLWNKSSQIHMSQKQFSWTPPLSQNYEIELLWLVFRYITVDHEPNHPTSHNAPNNHHTTPIIQHNTLLLTPNLRIVNSTLWSFHNKDIIFGATWHAKSSKRTSHGLCHPTDHTITLKAIHWGLNDGQKRHQHNYYPHSQPQLDNHIFTYNLNIIYPTSNHIEHPSSQPPPWQTTYSQHSSPNLLDQT